LVPAGGLMIYRNEAAVPPLAVAPDGASALAANAMDPAAVAGLPPVPVQAGSQEVEGGWDVIQGGGLVWVGDGYAPGWRLTGGASVRVPPEEALGWAMAFHTPEGAGSVEIRYDDQWIRSAEMAALAVLWLVAMWMTRKPARR